MLLRFVRSANWVVPAMQPNGWILIPDVEPEAEWQVGWWVGVRHVFLSEEALDRVPGEKSELKGWVKAEPEQEEWVWALGFLKVEPDSVSEVELKQELEQKAERAMRAPLSTVFFLLPNSSIQ